MDQVGITAQVIPGLMTTTNGHLRNTHFLFKEAGNALMAERVKPQLRESQRLGSL